MGKQANGCWKTVLQFWYYSILKREQCLIIAANIVDQKTQKEVFTSFTMGIKLGDFFLASMKLNAKKKLIYAISV
jgi:hypothetical protein